MYFKLPDTMIIFCLVIMPFFISNIHAHYHLLHANIAISCGNSGDATARDGRAWTGDSGFKSSMAPLLINGESTNSRAIHRFGLLDPVPYKTARISRNEFQYVIGVNPGQKFIRLHFYQDSWFRSSKASFAVKADHYTLLSNFSADALGVKHVIKEYCVNIKGDRGLTLTFTPATKMRKGDDFYAFINGIEVVSMPTGLYFTPDEESGAQVVGQKYRFYIDNATALELVQRLNAAGGPISSTEDSSMYCSWDDDTKFLLDSAAVRTWRIPVDMGFRYLIRLHFSKSQSRIGESGGVEFSIIINDQIAGDATHIFQLGVDAEVSVHKDYIVMMEGNKMVSDRNISVTLQKKSESMDHGQHHSILSGIEVFKLSNPDNNLAGMESFVELQSSISIPQQKKLVSLYSINSIVTMLTVTLVLLNIAVFHLKRVSDSDYGTSNTRSSYLEHRCRQFSIDEIRSSTNNFDLEFYIGKGGYGIVYKGGIDGGTETVAIKRRKLDSTQGDNEFWTEIRLLSKIRHQHLVSLIGYCKDDEERILVYQYMTQGTLADHLYKRKRHGKSNPIPWETRLNIAIGAASGLYYLHSRHRIIHRDVKSSNILLDDNWVAKISDFGLSKKGPATDSFSHISTEVKGTFGYLDPEYFSTHKLTKKSDVYAFGVVLFEVLSGRPAVNMKLEEEQRGLAEWVRYCIREGKVDQLVDQNLKERITPACLKFFVRIAGRCLHKQSQGRPTMADVVKGLELALTLQQNQDPVELLEEDENFGRIFSDQSERSTSMDEIRVAPPSGELDITVTSEDTSGSGSTHRDTDQKNAKRKAKDNSSNSNLPTRPWWDAFGFLSRILKREALPLPSKVMISEFSFQDIQKETENFSDNRLIGFGGSDNVYKLYMGSVEKVVAIRRSENSDSRLCMEHELQSRKEIQKKSSPNHDNVVSLIGYCQTESDMILVYDYSVNGTLHDHLHEPYRNPLPWKRRLEICIGISRGLSYLHSNVKQTMLHRYLKSTNIWLDKNWIPKVSEWGLSKKRGNKYGPNIVRSNLRYLDSDFIRGAQSTEKSYVYSFGLLLYEVLCADEESDRWLEEDQVSLAQWIKSRMADNLSSCIDPYLVAKASPDSLQIFIETAKRCLLDNGNARPSINEIVTRLKTALKQQEAIDGHRGGALRPRSSVKNYNFKM
ncbi:receptor-like protein kinase FERONIA [Henckelia pumila]|uniref:receptor-like protein kinase FERONIA n=1 Tax=Henckelia pumila TaxID=405737 RepID=UPI003C6E1554